MQARPQAHPSDQALQAYRLGRLEAASAESVAVHLVSCPACRRRAVDLGDDGAKPPRRDVGPAPETPSPSWSQSSASSPGPSRSPVGPPKGPLPPGLAGHPDYEVVGELGRGGMGVVYLVRNRILARDEVLKVVDSGLLGRPGILDRFLREIRNAARLNHPNVVVAYSAVRLDQTIALAMEHVDGYDLSRLIKSQGTLPVPVACNFIRQAALGLQHAHDEGMVHRDIKPSNLIVARQGGRPIVKVLDFGLAKASREIPIKEAQTRTGHPLGTPDFIAPEQILDAANVDIRADIYSLGASLYALLSGGPPFRARSEFEIYQAHISRFPEPLDQARPEVPAELAAIVIQMMAKEPGRRFAEPKEVAQALKPFIQKGDRSPSARTTAERSQLGWNLLDLSDLIRAGSPVGEEAAVVAEVADDLEPVRTDGHLIPRQRWEEPIDRAKPRAKKRAAAPRGDSDAGMWFAVAAAAVLLGLAALWGASALIPREGWLLIEGLPPGAEVFVDGDRKFVAPPGGGPPAKVVLWSGEREVRVRKDGFRSFIRTVTIPSNDRASMTVEMEALELARPAQSRPPARPQSPPAEPDPTPPPQRTIAPLVYESLDGRYRIQFTDHPNLSDSTVERDGVTWVSKVAVVDHSDLCRERVQFIEIQDMNEKSDANAVFDAFGEGLVNNAKAVLKRKTPITLNGHPGREVEVDVQSEQPGVILTGRVRFFLTRTRLYQVSITGPPSVLTPARIAGFLDSFQILDRPEPAPPARGAGAFGGSVPPTAARPGGGRTSAGALRKALEERRAVANADPNRALTSIRWLLPTGEAPEGGAYWAYSFVKPGTRWYHAQYDDSRWDRGRAGFGARDTPGIRVSTPWSSRTIWLRTRFRSPRLAPGDRLWLSLFHDEDVVIYLNGKLLYEGRGHLTRYQAVLIDDAKQALLHPDDVNVMAVACRNSGGGQGIDVGLVLQAANGSIPRAGAGRP